VKAGEVRDRLAALREAGVALRRRPGGEVIEVLAAVLDRWRDPDAPERRALERDLPGATGFSAPVVKEGLALALEPWSGEALRGVAQRLLARGDDLALGHDTTAVLLAGSIPMPSLLGVLEPLALRSPALVKPASRDPLTAHLVKRSIAAVDGELARCVEVADFESGDEACLAAFLQADCIVATGSDEAVEAVARRAPQRRVIRHGHRLSVGLLGPDATCGAPLARAAAGLARDVALWDQQGCLSPVAVYVVGGGRIPAEVLDAFEAALTAQARALPLGAVDPAAAALLAHERSGAELRAAADESATLRVAEDGSWTLVAEVDATPRPMPLHRFLRLHPLASLDAARDALGPVAPHLAGVAVAGFPTPDAARASEVLRALGASRLCEPGELQRPPLDWPRDGLVPFISLAQPAEGGAPGPR